MFVFLADKQIVLNPSFDFTCIQMWPMVSYRMFFIEKRSFLVI